MADFNKNKYANLSDGELQKRIKKRTKIITNRKRLNNLTKDERKNLNNEYNALVQESSKRTGKRVKSFLNPFD
jgi:Fe-S cluster biosynthesis and repair protein YggX